MVGFIAIWMCFVFCYSSWSLLENYGFIGIGSRNDSDWFDRRKRVNDLNHSTRRPLPIRTIIN